MKYVKIAAILIVMLASSTMAAPQKTTTQKATAKKTTAPKTTAKKAVILKTDLESYYELLLRNDPYAIITSSFWDWRSVSYYRRNAGYHFGYDIALPAGFAVPSGWDGKIISVIPWTNNEWGVSLRLSNGYTVTFGHIKPLVYTGMTIAAGTLVGTVVYDHVDVKITDPNGSYLDFGKTRGLLPINPNINYLSSIAATSKEDKAKIVKAKQRELAMLRSSSSIFKEYLNAEKELLEENKSEFEKKKQQSDDEIISRADFEKSDKNYKEQTKKVAQLEKRYNIQQKQITDILKELKSYGVTEKPQKLEKPKTDDSAQKRLAKAKAEVEKYEALYEQGVVSRIEKEAKEKEYRRLKLEIMMKALEQ